MNRTTRRQRVLSAALCAALSQGCGLTMIRGPDPRQPPEQKPDCTPSYFPSQLDVVVGGVGGLTMITVGGLQKDLRGNADVGVPLILAGVAVIALFYGSGTVGYFRALDCQKAQARWQSEQGPGADAATTP